MQCSTCRHEAIIFQPYSGRHLCRDHFIRDLEAKAKRAVRVHRGMQPGDHIAVVLNGGCSGNALLFFLQKLTGKRKDVRISAVISEGGQNAGDILPGITKIAVATTLEDAAASALTSILRGRVEPGTGHDSEAGDNLPQFAPFGHIPAEEIAVYARLCGVGGDVQAGGNKDDRLYADVDGMLADYASRHPAAPHAVLNLWESLAGSDGEEGTCNGS
jgi:tRNA(Ile)-lysidine synthase TilS/MesJ